MTMLWRAGFLALLLVFVAEGRVPRRTALPVWASVIDGDTIEIYGVRIRFFGIDTPEGGQQCRRPDGSSWRCGQQAALALSDHIERSTIRCEARDRDRYGRTVAVCFRGNEDLNRWIVASGWAVAYRQYSMDDIADEYAARRNRINIWSGNFDMPWDGGRATEPMMRMTRPESSTQEVLAGLVERVTFHNAENGFCVLGSRRAATAN